MGMKIDEVKSRLADYVDTYKVCGGENYNPATNITKEDCEAFEIAIDTMRKYQMMQADYEYRLKADMVAMLEDLQLDVEGQKFDVHIDKDVWNDAISICLEFIQEKINSLKVETESQESEE